MDTDNSSHKNNTLTGNKPVQKKSARGAKALAEAIILQSIEDLWSEEEKSKCISFFTGEGFHICAKMAGMDFDAQVKVLTIVKNISSNIKRTGQRSKGLRVKKGNFSAEAVMV